MLNQGATAPDFTLTDQHGNTVTLDSLLEKGPAVIYFYPADFTPACTKEACMIRDHHADLLAAGVAIAGISPQPATKKAKFAEKYNLPFPLLADPGKKVTKSYDALGLLGLYTDRITYRIGTNKKVTHAVKATLDVKAHEKLIETAINAAKQSA
ncbi:MAG: peroxiredoxin [Planctomycetota bacterium]